MTAANCDASTHDSDIANGGYCPGCGECKRDELYRRHEDMSPDGRLHILVQRDGDVIIGIEPSKEGLQHYVKSVEFCSIGSGGGRSPHTIKALRALAEAVAKDEADNPIEREAGG